MHRRDIIAVLLWPLMCAVSAHAQQVEIHWTPKASMPGSLYAFDAVTIGRAIYAVGGRGDREGYQRYTYRLDPDTKQWTEREGLIHDRSNHAVVVLDGKIYVFGGNENPDKSEVYDPDADVWEERAAMPTPRQHINYSAAALNGKIYVMGGIEKRGEREFVISDKNEEYDPATDTWNEKRPLPSSRQIPGVVGFRDRIYVISGTDDDWNDQTTVFAYHPENDAWETRAPMPEARYVNGVAVLRDLIVVVTGKRRDTKESKIFCYNPETNAWYDLGELPVNCMLAGVTSTDDRLYVLGGSTHEHILSTCWEADITMTSKIGCGKAVEHQPKGYTRGNRR